MNLLGIDTSTERASVALLANGDIRCKEQHHLRQHAQCLLPMIDELLSEQAMSLDQLNGIVFGCGPGSFTGLRITCSVAQALAYAHDLPVYPVTSLQAIASMVYETKPLFDGPVLAMLDARMQAVYWGYYLKNKPLIEPHVSNPADITVSSSKQVILAGVGLDQYTSQLPTELKSQIIETLTIYPQAETMVRLAQSGQIKAMNVADAAPLYVRHQVTQGATGG